MRRMDRFKDRDSRIQRLRERILAMHESGARRKQVAAAVGSSPAVVSYHARVLGLSFDKKGNRHV